MIAISHRSRQSPFWLFIPAFSSNGFQYCFESQILSLLRGFALNFAISSVTTVDHVWNIIEMLFFNAWSLLWRACFIIIIHHQLPAIIIIIHNNNIYYIMLPSQPTAETACGPFFMSWPHHNVTYKWLGRSKQLFNANFWKCKTLHFITDQLAVRTKMRWDKHSCLLNFLGIDLKSTTAKQGGMNKHFKGTDAHGQIRGRKTTMKLIDKM